MDPLVKAFSQAGTSFAQVLRKQLPAAVLGTAAEQARARATLQRAANAASLRLSTASRDWLKGSTLTAAVTKGQQQMAKQVGIQFGGVNLNLVQKLSLDVAKDLSRAAASTRPFLAQALRQATAVARERELGPYSRVTETLGDADRAITESLLRGALEQRTMRENAKTLLEDLDLDRGDKVLFLSGRRMGAEHYAELVTRTRVMEALNLAKADFLTSNGYEFIKISEHEGVAEDDICTFLQGKVWALTENDLGIPLLPEEYGLPPWHPNCRHTFGAWQPKFESAGDVQKAIDEHDDDEAALAEWDGAIVKK